ncbi:MAG: UTP--glucose-1-phosphate uridylyltransferase GalU [Alphaproteobacteria bacterium]
MAKKVKKAIFPVGGLGTRFLPATKALPKEMLPVVDKPLIQYAVEEAKAAGIEEFIFVTGRGKTTIEDHFDHSYELERTLEEKNKTDFLDNVLDTLSIPGQVFYTRQQEPLGLGHAVWCARHFADGEPVAVLLADDLILSQKPCLAQMMDLYDAKGGTGNIVATMEVLKEHTSRYGIITPGEITQESVVVNGLVEKPDPAKAPSNFAVIGRYILQPEVFAHLEKGERGAGGEIQLTDAMAKMIGHTPFYGQRFEGTRFDCGNKVGFLEANIAFALDRADMKDDVQNILKQYT